MLIERKEDGNSPFADISAEAHTQCYLQLAERTTQGPWHATHVKGKGYVKFRVVRGGRSRAHFNSL
jgi:hypothetical protein